MWKYEKETSLLRRCFFDVQNEVGLGRREEAYHRGCVLWLKANGIPYQSKLPHHLRFGVSIAHTLIPDLVLWDRVTLELKAVKRTLVSSDEVQLFNYLKYRGDDLGLLVNFGLGRVVTKRFLYDRRLYSLKDNWHQWEGKLSGETRVACVGTCKALRKLYSIHQTGYGEKVSSNLILGALAHEGIPFESHPRAQASFQGHFIDESTLDCLLIAGRIVLVSTALLDSNGLALSLGLSYMKALGVTLGVAVNLGKTEAQFTALRRSPTDA